MLLDRNVVQQKENYFIWSIAVGQTSMRVQEVFLILDAVKISPAIPGSLTRCRTSRILGHWNHSWVWRWSCPDICSYTAKSHAGFHRCLRRPCSCPNFEIIEFSDGSFFITFVENVQLLDGSCDHHHYLKLPNSKNSKVETKYRILTKYSRNGMYSLKQINSSPATK